MTTADMIQELGKRISQLELTVTEPDDKWQGEIHKLYVARGALLDLVEVEA